MKTLALAINNTPVQVPGQISQVNSLVGDFGIGFIHLIFSLMFFTAGVLVLFFTVWGGFRWMTSQGDKKKLEEARATIIYAVVGLVIIFLSFLLVNLIGGFFGVNLLQIGASS